MSKTLDLANWARRDVFNFFRDFDKPYFNVCTGLDVSPLLAQLRARRTQNVSLAYHYFALRVANEVEPFRYRLRAGEVIVHEVVHGGTTVLLPNDTFALAYFDFYEDFETFMREAMKGVREAQSVGFRPLQDDARIHFTTLPWFSFTSFSHARNWRQEDSIPKIAFGKFVVHEDRTLMPISVEVHHALMDGLHVGRYLSRLEDVLKEPEEFLS